MSTKFKKHLIWILSGSSMEIPRIHELIISISIGLTAQANAFRQLNNEHYYS